MIDRGVLPRVIGRKDEEGFSLGLEWTFHSAGGFSLLDRKACPRGQAMLCAELPPWTLVFINTTNDEKKTCNVQTC